MNKTMAEKFEYFFSLFEPKSIEKALKHFLYQPSEKGHTLKNDKLKIEITFPDESIFAEVKKLK